MKKIVYIASIALIVVSCKSKGWSKAEVDAFTNTCVDKTQSQAGFTADKSKSYCSCMLQKLQAKYANADEANTKSTNTEMTEMAKDCLK